MTPAEAQHIREIERDRRRREAALLALLLAFTGKALTQARSAVKLGLDPAQAAADVIRGTGAMTGRHIHWQGMAVKMAPVINETYYAGAHRAASMAGVKIETPDEPPIAESAAQAAQELADRTITAVTRVISAAVDEAKDLNATKQATAISEAMRAAGMVENVDGNAHAIEAAAERVAVTQYGAGMFEMWETKAVDRVLGYGHYSVLDKGTTQICRERDGLKLPREDAYWRKNWPSLHWKCRSVTLGIFKPFKASTVYPVTPPAPGFGTAPLIAFGSLVGR